MQEVEVMTEKEQATNMIGIYTDLLRIKQAVGKEKEVNLFTGCCRSSCHRQREGLNHFRFSPSPFSTGGHSGHRLANRGRSRPGRRLPVWEFPMLLRRSTGVLPGLA